MRACIYCGNCEDLKLRYVGKELFYCGETKNVFDRKEVNLVCKKFKDK